MRCGATLTLGVASIQDIRFAIERTMLTIRRAQLVAFSEADVQRFEHWMLAHLRTFFPKHCEAAGEFQLRETIRYGIKRAPAHGFRSKRDVCKYIDLMVVLGRDFDTDEQYPWAVMILTELKNPETKMSALHAAAKNYLTRF
jgi:hypothetical protein